MMVLVVHVSYVFYSSFFILNNVYRCLCYLVKYVYPLYFAVNFLTSLYCFFYFRLANAVYNVFIHNFIHFIRVVRNFLFN